MVKIRSYQIYFLLVIWILGAGLGSAIAQSGTRMSIRPGDADSLRDTFLDILVGGRKPGGLVLVKRDCGDGEKKDKLLIPEGNMEERLAFVIKHNPEYRVSFANDVINLTPNASGPDFLNSRIDEFNIDTNHSIGLVLSQLLKLKEVKLKADALGVNKGFECCGGLQSPNRPREQAFVYLANVTLREALNEISRAYKHAVWVYSDSKCNGKKEVTLRFPVR